PARRAGRPRGTSPLRLPCRTSPSGGRTNPAGPWSSPVLARRSGGSAGCCGLPLRRRRRSMLAAAGLLRGALLLLLPRGLLLLVRLRLLLRLFLQRQAPHPLAVPRLQPPARVRRLSIGDVLDVDADDGALLEVQVGLRHSGECGKHRGELRLVADQR